MAHVKYLQKLFDPLTFEKTVDKLISIVEPTYRSHEIDAIAFTGISGSGIGFPVALLTGIPMMCVRKAGIDSHNRECYIERSHDDIKTYVILDDLMSSGRTVTRIMDIAREELDAKCVGILLYEEVPRKHHINQFDLPISSIWSDKYA